MHRFALVSYRQIIGIAFALIVIAVPVGPASAQGLLDLIFGPSQATSAEADNKSNGTEAKKDHSEVARKKRPSRFRTICVRMCDGYYFPINHATPRSKLHLDEEMCQARCSSEVRLFYMPSSTSRVKDAYDRGGQAYRRIKNAFLYRKRLVKGCGCRPQPWSEAARKRHRRYEIVERMAKGDAGSERVAVNAARETGEATVAVGPAAGAVMVQSPVPVPRKASNPAAVVKRLRRRTARRRVRVRRKAPQKVAVKNSGWGLGSLLGAPSRTNHHRRLGVSQN